MGLTITEALAEIKTVGKRLEHKKQAVLQNIGRDARVKDPLEREGGAVEYIKRERQAIADLEKRIVAIRTAIQKANLNTTATVNGTTLTVSEWLTWRREVSASSKQFLTQMNQTIVGTRNKIQAQGARVVSATSEADAKPGDVVIHLDEKALLEDIEKTETILGELDGKLSLLNATTVIEV